MRIVFIPRFENQISIIKNQLKKMGRSDIFVFSGSEYFQENGDVVEINVEADKQDALLLDFGRNLDRHGPIDKITGSVYVEKDGSGEAPIKNCPNCHAVVHAAVTICPECGTPFPLRELKIETEASTEAVFSFQKPAKLTVKPELVKLARHKSKTFGNPDTLRVTYVTPLGDYSEYICFDHPEGSYAHAGAIRWAKQDPDYNGFIYNIEDALKYNWTVPCNIDIVKKDKYWNVVRRSFNE